MRMSAGRRLAVVAPVVRVVYEAVELDPTRVVGAVVVDFVVAPFIAGVQSVRPVVVAGVVMVADRIRLAVQLGVPCIEAEGICEKKNAATRRLVESYVCCL